MVLFYIQPPASEVENAPLKGAVEENVQHRSWLLFTAQTPAAPSSLRVQVWRRMQQAGAISLHGVWLLPYTDVLEQRVRDLLQEMERQGGSGFFFISQSGDALYEERIIARFQLEREQEYREFSASCLARLQECEKKMAARSYTRAELEKQEEHLRKLISRLHKINTRDFFQNPERGEAISLLAHYHQVVHAFAQHISA